MSQSRNDALVGNAGSKQQVEKAKTTERIERDQQLDDLNSILNTEGGRRFLWRVLDHLGVFKSVFEPNSRIAYNAGLQDAGHFILAEIVEAQPEALLTMMKESQERAKK